MKVKELNKMVKPGKPLIKNKKIKKFLDTDKHKKDDKNKLLKKIEISENVDKSIFELLQGQFVYICKSNINGIGDVLIQAGTISEALRKFVDRYCFEPIFMKCIYRSKIYY